MSSLSAERPLSERALLLLLAAVQFVNVLDFMIVMPLGPDFAGALGIRPSQLGYVAGSYTAAAAVSGVLGALFLDRFDRKRALLVSLLGLAVGTAAGGLSTSFATLLLTRVVAGLFGGPATSLALSIVADVIPAERRGRALALVMAAFSVATVVGVPLGLELSRHGGWRLPLFSVGGLGLAVAVAIALLMPPLRGHLDGPRRHDEPAFRFLGRPAVLLALGANISLMMSIFLVVPNLSAYVQYNLGYPRERLHLLYLVGGVASFASMAGVGRLVDRFGPVRVGTAGTGVLVATYLAFFVHPVAGLSPALMFVVFMVAGSLRGVSINTLASRVPAAHERARYMSLQSAVQHLSSAAGSFLSARMLTEEKSGHLVGMAAVAMVGIAVSLGFPLLATFVERELDRRAPGPI